MTTIKATAHAKINLTLHVTGQRPDGYHLLDSLVVFAALGDQIIATTDPNLHLTVRGPFAHGVPTDDSNLILRAAEVLRQARGIQAGARITVEKNLPHGAGIGGGSADAAATLNMLATLWNVPPLDPADPRVVALGADVPVCMRAPAPMRMEGIGDVLTPLKRLPQAGLVLVNPRVHVPTPQIFAGLHTKTNDPMTGGLHADTLDSFTDWLSRQRNDLTAPAAEIAPDITEALRLLRSQSSVKWAGMSGSGATCVGIVRDMGAARQVARSLQIRQQGWWVVPTPLIS